jgi:site-specific DNA recombinase
LGSFGNAASDIKELANLKLKTPMAAKKQSSIAVLNRAVIYCRVSTKEQTQNLSLETQEKECRKYCRLNGLSVARVFIEKGESAKTADRTEFKRMLASMREQKGRIQHVIVYSISRFARSVHDHSSVRNQLRSLGISLRSVTEQFDDSPTGQLMESVLASFAQFDNDIRAERTIAGMQSALEKGRWTFKPPLGYKSGGRECPSLVLDQERAPLVKAGFERFATGLYSQPEVLEYLRLRGLRTLKGKPISPQTFGQLLRRGVYAGRITVKGWADRVAGDFEALVSQETFDKVQAVLDGKKPTVTSYKRNHPDFPLRQFIRCGICESPLTGSASTGRSKRKYLYYHCHKKGCKPERVRKDDLERAFLHFLNRLRPKNEYLKLFNEIVLDVWHARQRDCLTLTASLQTRIEELQTKQERIEEAFLFEKSIDRGAYERQRDKVRESLLLAEMDLRDAKVSECDVEGLLEYAGEVISNAGKLWIEFNLDQKQRFQNILFPNGLVFNEGEFRTGVTCPVFNVLQGGMGAEERMATLRGFEPRLPP